MENRSEMENGQQPTKALPLVLSQQQRSEDWRRSVGAILSRLGLHFWRPDFTEGQAKLLFSDLYSDLADFSPNEISTACATWRRNPENRFFPTSGQLIGIMRPTVPSEPRLRLEPFKDYPKIEGRRATKSAAQIIAEHGFSQPMPRVPMVLPHATNINGPVTPELKASKIAQWAMEISKARCQGDF